MNEIKKKNDPLFSVFALINTNGTANIVYLAETTKRQPHKKKAERILIVGVVGNCVGVLLML